MSRTEVAEAVRQGTDAGRAGHPPNVCPYGRHDILRTAWIRGYTRGRREAPAAAE